MISVKKAPPWWSIFRTILLQLLVEVVVPVVVTKIVEIVEKDTKELEAGDSPVLVNGPVVVSR